MKSVFPILFLLGVLALVFGPGIYGLYLAFHASVVLGCLVLLAQPAPIALGWIAIFGRPDVAEQIAKWLHLV